jgi:hypothetical protein|tara:strand:+ start:443 stop:805 length:363 start_codon:yes stop_codon:yes gene_type:complete
MRNYLVEALIALAPNCSFSTNGDTYADIIWKSTEVTKPSETEVNNKITELKNGEPMRLLRIERDNRLAACDWRASSDLTLSDSWKTYRQALRDLPTSASPKLNSNGDLDYSSVTFPTEPS